MHRAAILKEEDVDPQSLFSNDTSEHSYIASHSAGMCHANANLTCLNLRRTSKRYFNGCITIAKLHIVWYYVTTCNCIKVVSELELYELKVKSNKSKHNS